VDNRSLRNLVKELGKKGHKVCPTVVGDLLRRMGYSLQANSKTREGNQHIDRDAQFHYINRQAKAFLAAHEPVVSVDTNYARIRIMHGFPRLYRSEGGKCP
jgi:DDE family transposase